MRARSFPLILFIACSCTQAESVHVQQASAAANGTQAIEPQSEAKAKTPEPKRDELLEWVRGKLPQGGAAERDAQGALVVTHEAGAKDTIYTVAKAYLDLTSVYLASDLATAIGKQNGMVIANKKVTIPSLLSAPYKIPDEERLAWPDEDRGGLRMIYLGGRD